MEMLGMHGGLPRAPLLPLSEDNKEDLRRILQEAELSALG